MKIFSYDTTIFDFKSIIEKHLEHDHLDKIHSEHHFNDRLVHGTDQSQPLHKKFYQSMDSDEDQQFVVLYLRFIREQIKPRYSGNILYQKFPTFRVHQPGNVAVFGWHRNKDYNHNHLEVNYCLPITNAYGTNTFFYESEPDKKDFKPMEVNYGQCAEWDGANCRHGNKANETDDTRISFDFRILTVEAYESEPPKKSISKGKSFEIGDYYEVMEDL